MPAGPDPMTAAFRPLFAWTSNGTGGSWPSSSMSRMTMSPA